MVATIEALKGGTSGAGSVAGYFTSAAGDYYAAERPGEWWGEGAKLLGLSGQVERRDFENLLAGFSPTGEALSPGLTVRPRFRKPAKRRGRGGPDQPEPPPCDAPPATESPQKERKRCIGYDLAFSAPKSVSILWAIGDGQTRRAIEQAILSAVRSTLQMVQETISLGRRGRGGMQQEASKLAASIFLHTTSRDLEPQLHVHAVIPNLCRGQDGRWAAVNSRLLHSWTPALGRVFRCTFGEELMQRLGVKLVRPLDALGREASWFEVEGVPLDLLRQWSSRRKAILDRLEGSPERVGRSAARAREAANLVTRRRKAHKASLEELLPAWREEARRHGFDAASVERLKGQAQARSLDEPYLQAFKQALQDLSMHNAHFPSRDVVQRVCEVLQDTGNDGLKIARRVLRDLENSPDVVPLQPERGERRYTTLDMWRLEQKLLADVMELKSHPGCVVPERLAEKVIAGRPTLSQEQTKAARELLTQEQGIRVLSGVAGAGKSFTLDTVRDGFERAGYRVLGGALSGAAKEELARQTSIDSRTVASYLYHLDKTLADAVCDRLKHDARQMLRALLGQPTYAPDTVKLNAQTVLILDEAGMLDTGTLQRLVKHVKAAGATMILAGDTKQLPPILAGGPMDRIARRVGQSHLRENRRQSDPDDRKAVELLRHGQAKKAFENYAERGRITIGKDRRETIEALVKTWVKEGGVRRPADHMIFTQTRAEAALINNRCQEERLRALRTLPLLSLRVGEERLHIGDRVLFHAAYRAQGIENGYRGVVVAVDPILRQLKIQLDQPPTPQNQARGLTRLVTVPLRKLPPNAITLGYAATTHKLQGQTVQHGYLLLGGRMTDREMAYVQATRAKQTTRVFIDQLHAGEELKEIIRAVQRSRAKNLAHDVQEKPRKLSQQYTLTHSIQQT